jgi:formylglycine-generating enzyme required for sulfatase activity
MKTAVGPADLVRVFTRLALRGREARDEGAAALGLQRRASESARHLPAEMPAPAVPQASPAVPVTMRFWRLESATIRSGASPAVEDLPKPLGARDLAAVAAHRNPARAAEPLAPWNRVWPQLRSALGGAASGGAIDLRTVVRMWARLEPLKRLPRVHRAAWPRTVNVWLDSSRRLAMIADEQHDVRDRLMKLGVQVDGLVSGEQRAPILLLSDLGCYGHVADSDEYVRAARRLRAAGRHVAALVPAPASRWEPRAAEAWNAVPWVRGRVSPRGGTHAVDRLLTLLSPTSHAEPGLVRALRKLMDPLEADVSTEMDLCFSSDVACVDRLGVVLRPEAYAARRDEFARLDPVTRLKVAELIRAYHCGQPEQLLAETLAWHEHGADRDGVKLGDLDEARAFLQRVAPTLTDPSVDRSLALSLRVYATNAIRALPESSFGQSWLAALWMATLRDTGAPMPASIDPDSIPEPSTAAPRRWALHQVGGALVASLAGSGRWPSLEEHGSPIALITAASSEIWLQSAPGRARLRHQLVDGATLSLPGSGYLQVVTDSGVATLRAWSRPKWATAAGRDAYGLWATFTVEGVDQRMRWIPPGRFRMGSPLGEAGRKEDEELCEVVISDGFWLGETPVTQALWVAVMAENPSRFVFGDRPVEQVSWDACISFCEVLDDRVRGLSPRLPMEAEWEYACRAGTGTATWLDEVAVASDADGAGLERIAWYGASATVAVAKREPNPFGLYDMLGNVHEWCLGQERAIDAGGGVTYEPKGVLAVRGGAWGSHAFAIRAASRLLRSAGDAADDVGFRLAAGWGMQQGARVNPRSAPHEPKVSGIATVLRDEALVTTAVSAGR